MTSLAHPIPRRRARGRHVRVRSVPTVQARLPSAPGPQMLIALFVGCVAGVVLLVAAIPALGAAALVAALVVLVIGAFLMAPATTGLLADDGDDGDDDDA